MDVFIFFYLYDLLNISPDNHFKFSKFSYCIVLKFLVDSGECFFYEFNTYIVYVYHNI